MMLTLVLTAASYGVTFSNTSPIDIQFGGGFPAGPMPADLYPSQIEVSGITGPVQNVSVTLHDVSHTWPDDLHVLLVGPTGQTVALVAHVGGSADINNIDLIFDDNAPSLPPDSQITGGVYSPTGTITITMETPAPSGPYGTTLSGFEGLDPVGVWNLYVMDDHGDQDGGSIAGGWSLTFGPNVTYQGRLLDNNIAADGLYDMQFGLYDNSNTAIASQVGPTIIQEDIEVVDGYFVAELAFGDAAFNGDNRWLQIEVRPFDSIDPNDYVALSPLQPISHAPYAIHAASSDWNNLANMPVDFADGVDDTGIGAETDPVFGASAAAGVTSPDITNWNAAFSWGDHSTAGYLTGYSETDPQVGSNTTNYVPKWNGSTLVTGTIYDNGNVGIGTTTPDGLLTLGGADTKLFFEETNPAASLYYDGEGKNGTNNLLHIRSEISGAEGNLMTWKLDGTIGIGTETPEGTLHIKDVGADGPALFVEGGTSTEGDLTWKSTEHLQVGTWDMGTDTFTELLRITDSGDVGIGTSSPTEKLSVAGIIESTSGGVKFPDGSTQTTAAASFSLPYADTASTAGDAFSITNTDNSTTSYAIHGNSASDNGAGVYGTTTGSGALSAVGVLGETNTGEYAVKGVNSWAAGGAGVYGKGNKGVVGESDIADGDGIVGSAWASTGDGCGVRGFSASADGAGVLGYGVAGGYDFYAEGPGTNYGSASSGRWKENIKNIDGALSKVMSLRGVYFDWDLEHGGQHDMGMIAEEVGQIVPEIVDYENNGIDASGMDYSKLTPLLVEAVKQQQQQIESLQAEIDDLKKQLQQ